MDVSKDRTGITNVDTDNTLNNVNTNNDVVLVDPSAPSTDIHLTIPETREEPTTIGFIPQPRMTVMAPANVTIDYSVITESQDSFVTAQDSSSETSDVADDGK